MSLARLHGAEDVVVRSSEELSDYHLRWHGAEEVSKRCSIGAARSSRIIIYEEESTALLSARNNVETCACTLRHESDWRMYRAIGHRPLGGACIVVCSCIFISAKTRARGGLAK